jgi:hypothetical protein
MKLGTGYDYPDLPGLGNNNEKLELPERLSTGIQFRIRNLFHEKTRVIVILFVDDGRQVMAKAHIAFGKVNYKEY